MRINLDTGRVISVLRKLAQFGAHGQGVCRPALSAADIAARHWLAGQLEEAGLESEIDSVGNLYGRTPGVQRAILTGSHSDSVPTGGWLDGALGVAYALEIARAWRRQCPGSPIGIDVIVFSDEEGRYLSCLGSRSFCGMLDGVLLGAVYHDGISFLQAARQVGLSDTQTICLEPDRHIAFFEAHIEQGPRLDQAGMDLGIVTGIAGMRRYLVRFSGRADHAGTTPMNVRQDASMAAFEFALTLEKMFLQAAGSDSVWNIGAISLDPGVANVVARFAELTVEFRDLSNNILEKFDATLRDCVKAHNGSRKVACDALLQNELTPVNMTVGLQEKLTEQARRYGARHMSLPSGAIHDAMVLARKIPTAMLFVPSIAGRSHTPDENTSERQITLGAQVFCNALVETAATIR